MSDPIMTLAAIDPDVLERASRVIRVLGHPVRLRLLELLEDRERNVTELVFATGLNQATVSQQLRLLRAEGVVDDRRDGARVFYRITEPKVIKILDCIRECDVPDLPEPGDGGRGSSVRILTSASQPRAIGRRDQRTTR